jgi:hypothetical protein
MNVKNLIEILKQYPEDMEVWVSDRGYVEGGERLTKVEKIPAYHAGLDGDEINGEYIYVCNNTDVDKYLNQGYLITEDGEILTKEIVYLNNI